MTNSFFTGIFIGAMAMLVICGLMLLRPAPAIGTAFGGKRTSFTTKVPLADAYRAVANVSPGKKFTVARSDESIKRVLLADGFSMTSWGFYYPVDFAARPDGGTDVTVGIRSKALQWGPLVGRAQKKMMEQVQGLVEARPY